MKDTQLIATVCPYCGCGCGLYVGVEEGVARKIEYMPDHPASRGALCPKGNAALEMIHHPDRLRYPMKKDGSGWKRLEWAEAIDLVATRLKEISGAHGADALGFLSSARCSNEENYLMQKLARRLGTNNVDHCARL